MKTEIEMLYGINLIKEVIANRPNDVISFHITSSRNGKRLNELIQIAESENITIRTEKDDFFKNYDVDLKAKVCIKCKIKHEEKEAFLIDLIKKDNLLHQQKTKHKHHFYVSDYTTNFQKKTKLFFPKSIILEQENIFS